MTAYRPDHRDPLTMRAARQVRDTISDPWAYSEGSSEPQYIVESDSDHAVDHAVDRGLRRWGPLAIVVLIGMAAAGWL